jgi:putative protein-disulfide isomerase
MPHASPAVTAVAQEANLALDLAAFERCLTEDKDLGGRTNARIAETRALMTQLPSSGVPQLLVSAGGRGEVLHGAPLYAGPDEVLRAIREVEASLTGITA